MMARTVTKVNADKRTVMKSTAETRTVTKAAAGTMVMLMQFLDAPLVMDTLPQSRFQAKTMFVFFHKW
jgi:hypothetical protein